MKKLIIALFVSALTVSTVPAVVADTPPTIAVIDVGTNSSLFTNAIATEVCVISSYKCPNGKLFMEGPGAANIAITTNKEVNHGTQMLSIVTMVNPSAKIIPIRIAGINPNGNLALYSLEDVKAALDWVIANRIKYNIAVVSLSQGRIFANCKVPVGMAAQIATLKAAQVPVITAVGNDGNHTTVMAPSCLTDTVAVGATDNPYPGVQPIAYDVKAVPYIARYSNGAQGQTDFFLNARWYTLQLDGTKRFTVGTSNATAALSGYWLLNRKATFDETFASILSNTTKIKNEFQSGSFVTIDSLSLGNNK
ncbi:unannotated protein [freshwater metagenome]|uniref:Unannotated protein n=1 Tax=freshwater metagenome TaxID=449393 RepID=A0A6J6UIS4_9ZZZZ|nr:hypothetical protein [Actinomycetota bacterium]